MWQFLLFFIFILLIHILSRTLEEKQKESDENYGIFDLPPLKTPPPSRKTKKIPITKIEEKIPITPNTPEAVTSTAETSPNIKPIEKKDIDLDSKKLEEAIILLEIIGPPKALKRY